MGEPNLQQIVDGLALWQGYMPQSGEDWVAVAERCVADPEFDVSKSSPLFAGLVLAVKQRDVALASGSPSPSAALAAELLADDLIIQAFSLGHAYGRRGGPLPFDVEEEDSIVSTVRAALAAADSDGGTV